MNITPYIKNAKRHPESQLQALANIIKRVGWRQPVLVNQKGVIIAGHGRYMTWEKYATSHNLKEVWVIDDKGKPISGCAETKPMTEADEKAYRLADNKLNESEWDMGLVIEELQGLTPELLDLTGFSSDLIIMPNANDDVVPSVPKVAKSVLGDLYELGGHRVLCGDCTSATAMQELMAGQKAHMVFTDPPYNVAYVGKTKEKMTIDNDKMSPEFFRQFVEKFITNLLNFCDGVLYICMSSSEWGTVQSAFVAGGGALVKSYRMGQR